MMSRKFLRTAARAFAGSLTVVLLAGVMRDGAGTVRGDDYTGIPVWSADNAVPPAATAVRPFIFTGSAVTADDFVVDAADGIRLAFVRPPDVSRPGWQDVSVSLTDAEGRTSWVNSSCYIFETVPECVIEAGTAWQALSARNFVSNYLEGAPLTFSLSGEPQEFLSPGSYTVTVKAGEFSGKTALRVTDTTAPSATVKDGVAYLGKAADAKRLVGEISDASEVTVRFRQPPDLSKLGTQAVTLLLEDAYNNVREYTTRLNVVQDTLPPGIYGTLDKSVRLRGTVAYKTGVTISDNYDPEPALTVDSSQVKLNAPGTYTVTYTATDESGNKSQATGTVTVLPLDMETVNEMADAILADITRDGMSRREKAYAIFNYVADRVKYQSGNSPRQLAEGAYACFTKGAGDCYVYKAGSQVLLARAGIPLHEIERYQGKTEHYWLLVNTGDGWYHFDTCANVAIDKEDRFMFTDSQAREYTRIIGNGRRYYEYDASAVPDVVD